VPPRHRAKLKTGAAAPASAFGIDFEGRCRRICWFVTWVVHQLHLQEQDMRLLAHDAAIDNVRAELRKRDEELALLWTHMVPFDVTDIPEPYRGRIEQGRALRERKPP
jgi:hypothetical protein